MDTEFYVGTGYQSLLYYAWIHRNAKWKNMITSLAEGPLRSNRSSCHQSDMDEEAEIVAEILSQRPKGAHRM
jgi:hypothetical protein